MTFTYYGHSCFGIKLGGKNLLFDPFISQNPHADHINISRVEADYIFLSHGHEDHLADAPAIAASTGAVIVAGFEVANWLKLKGINHCVGMNTGGQQHFGFGTVKCVSAIHSSQLPDGSYGGNPLGFVVMHNAGSFYYSGDTALTVDMQLIPMFAKIDFAVLPIGDFFTMGADDAVQAAKMAGTQKVIGVHYDTFDAIRINKETASDTFRRNNLQLLLPGIGESIEL